jgi:tRNA A-37 threonylcarbamoyl transferase component Bud32
VPPEDAKRDRLTPDQQAQAATLPAKGQAAPAAAEPARSFTPGTRVAGRYLVVRFVAGGGMGEVYEAEDLLLQERVALKAVRRDVAHDPTTAERFRREIQLARRVTHPNVCRIFEVGFHEGVAFLSMEYLAGETLSERLDRKGRVTPAEAAPLLRQLAAGLGAAHDAGIVHRDFKSHNVILVPTPRGERAVITDFGLARAVAGEERVAHAVTRAGDLVGTPAYMAPEQVDGGAITPATDIYALGVVLYELLTGKLPFGGDTPLATAQMRVHEPPPSPRQHVADLDPRWEAAILRCLARAPDQRFATAAEVVDAVTDRPLAAPGPRSRRVLVAAIAAAVVAAALAVATVRALHRAPPRAPAPAVVPRLPTEIKFLAEVDRAVRKTADLRYDVDRAFFLRLPEYAAFFAISARLVASKKEARPDGVKIYAIRPNTLYAKLGFDNGDTVHAINGAPVTRAEDALALHAGAAKGQAVYVEITRDGKPATIQYTLR